MSTERYSALSRLLHWLSAAIIFALIGVALYMTDLDKADPLRGSLYNLHKSFGVLILFLLLLRLAWLRLSPAPALPTAFSAGERRFIATIKGLVYLLLLLVPLAGYVMSLGEGHPVHFFGLFDLPALVGKNHELGEFAENLHEALAYTLLALVGLHVAGAIRHRLMDRGGPTDVLQRML